MTTPPFSLFVHRILDVANDHTQEDRTGSNAVYSTPFDAAYPFPLEDVTIDCWHPSGWSPVFDARMNFVGFTNLKSSEEYFEIPEALDGERLFAGFALRMIGKVNGFPPHWAYWVTDGNPADMPGLWVP